MTTRIVLPITRKCCASNRFSDTFPPALSGYCTADEYRASIQRINAALRPKAFPVVVHSIVCLFYICSFSWFLQAYGMINYGYYYGYSDGLAGYSPLLSLCLWTFLMVISSRWFRNKRVDAVTKQVIQEHENYSSRINKISLRIINPVQRSSTLEIDLLPSVGQSQLPQSLNININGEPQFAVSSPPVYSPPSANPVPYNSQDQPGLPQQQQSSSSSPSQPQLQQPLPSAPHPTVYPTVNAGVLPTSAYVPFFSHPQPSWMSQPAAVHPTVPVSSSHLLYPSEIRQPLVSYQH